MSIQLDVRTEIDRPIEEVFEFVTAVENDEKWHPRVVESTPVNGEMTEGATWQEISEGMMGTNEIVMECIEYDPPNRFGYRTPEGFFGGRVKTTQATYTFTRNGNGTHVEWTGTFDVSGVLRFFRPILARMARKDLETSFEELESQLEGPD